MGFKVKIEGAESIDLNIESILSVEFKTDTPDDSNARSTDLGTTLAITGKILTPVDGEAADNFSASTMVISTSRKSRLL